jgi:signal transduction histidine kinase
MLKERIEISSGRNKVKIYKELGEYYYGYEQLDSASYYFIQGNEVALMEELNYFAAFFYLRLGMIENTRANFQDALMLLGEAKEQVQETEAYELESDIFRNTGNIYWGMGIYDKALDNYLRSLEIATLNNLSRNIASATNNIGNVYQAVKDFKKARDYYERAYELAKENEYKWIAAISANNIGDLLKYLNKPDSSIFYFTLSYNILDQLDSKFYKGIILFNIGEIYLQIDSIDLAREYLFRSLDLANQSDDKLGIVNCYLKIGESYLQESNFKQAKYYIDLGENHANETGSFSLLELAYRLKTEYFASKGQMDSAFISQKKQIEMKDSLSRQESGESIVRLENRYKDEKTSIQIDSLKRDKVNARRLFMVVVIAILIILTIIIISLHNARKKSIILTEKNDEIEIQQNLLKERNEELIKSQDELKTINDAKDQFVTILAHDLKNPVSAIRGFVELMIKQYDSISDEKKKFFLQEIFDSIEKVSLLLTNVLFWVRSQTKGIKNQPEYHSLYKRIDTNLSLYRLIAQDKKISMINNIPEELIIYADLNILDTIIRNLISNSLKFTPKEGKIEFSARNENNLTILEIKDTGIGISKDKIDEILKSGNNFSSTGTKKEQGTGLGLGLVQDFILLLGGELEIHSDLGKGTTILLKLPLPKENLIK